MYFKDLTTYKYMDKEEALNIGWLKKGHFFKTGEVPEEFIEKLWRYLRYPIQVCRGFHMCDFCKNTKTGMPTVTFKGETRKVGYYEIRVYGQDEKLYAAPSLIIHYILQHHYKPPQEFIDAVIYSDAHSKEYYQKILAYSKGYDFWLAQDCTKL